MFKTGKVTKEELIDFEWRIFELKEQINQIDQGEY
jgi:hypothetical protein